MLLDISNRLLITDNEKDKKFWLIFDHKKRPLEFQKQKHMQLKLFEMQENFMID